MANQRIGDLNGWWAFCFKLATLCIPLLCGAFGWSIVDRISVASILAAKVDVDKVEALSNRLSNIEGRIPTEGFPPKTVWDRFTSVEARIDRNLEQLEGKIGKLEDKLDTLLFQVRPQPRQ